MQEMWKLHAEGKLEGSQKLLFQDKRPVEELYDIQKDPWEINNLAGNPKYKKELDRLGKALSRWMDEICDLGEIDETVMVRNWYPNGVQPETAAPVFVPINAESPGVDHALQEIELKAPVLLQIYCATQGASIGYTFDESASPAWDLYSGPLRLTKRGRTTIRAKAIRIGYKESIERKIVIKMI